MKVLLISHDASQTGAPILLLNLAKVLREQTGLEISFLLKKGGPLKSAFQDVAQTKMVSHLFFVEKPSILQWVKREYLRNDLKKYVQSFDLIISNTITNGNLLSVIRGFYKGLIISYIHELRMAAGDFTTEAHIKSLIKATNLYLVPSEAVRSFLVNKYQIADQVIVKLNYYIPAYEIDNSGQGINKRKFSVGAAGTLEWRKGPDLFIQVAREVFRKRPDVAIDFIWCGANDSIELRRLQFDIEKSGLSGKVKFQLASKRMSEFYRSIDLFLLTSREDPYPLVVLEAAGECVPTICFADAGGAPEFISAAGAGISVAYLDVCAMADSIIFYYGNIDQLEVEGNQAMRKLREIHQDHEFIYGQFKKVLNKLFQP